MTDRREILEFSGPDDCGIYYVEGHSPWMEEHEPPGTWFCFEETINRANSILTEMGFTNEEIEEAKARNRRQQLGTCGGCGAYGPLGDVHVRQEECGTYV